MGYIRCHSEIILSSEFEEAAEFLGIKRVEFIGSACLLWTHFYTYAKDGNLRLYNAHVLASAGFHEGDEDRFLEALIIAKVVHYEGNKLCITNWDYIKPDGHLHPLRKEWDRMRRKLSPVVHERDGHRCTQCGAQEKLSIDHIYPISRGGGNDLDNLTTLCRPCNSRKGARI